MSNREFNVLVGGAAGMGVKTAGEVLARSCTRAGLHVFQNVEYPSIIRGGHNSVQLAVAPRPVLAHAAALDLLLPLDRPALDLHLEDVRPGGAVLLDAGTLKFDPGREGRDDLLLVDVPMKAIAKEAGLKAAAAVNSVGLGAAHRILGAGFDGFASRLREALGSLKPDLAEKNLAAARAGYDAVPARFVEAFGVAVEPVEAPGRMLLTGNDALALGAIRAGLKVYAGYPMTPSSSILSFLAKRERDLGIVVKHAEDEIAAIGIAVGASFAGARAMTATSGGGFALMSEFLGLAGMTEIPLVIAECQRAGPSTGLPTRTEQSDLLFALSASQGDFPRIVLAPGDPEECFRLGFEAFNLADRFQTPVVLLLDKHLSESSWTVAPFDTAGMEVDRGEIAGSGSFGRGTAFRRHAVTASGVSPRTFPGTPGGTFTTTGDAHDAFGRITEEEGPVAEQMDKRMRKLAGLDVSRTGFALHGDPDADVTLVGWGSTKGVILEAMARLGREGARCNFLQIRALNPFPDAGVRRVLEKAPRALLVEHNATAQLGRRIRERTGIEIEEAVLQYTGRQFTSDGLAARLRELL
jgi:2-oxoglutarate ferredoxin oxidoreductase subunit alpha